MKVQLATAFSAHRLERLPHAWAVHPILAMQSHSISLLLRSHLLQLIDRFAIKLLQMAAASQGEERLQWSVSCWEESSLRDRPHEANALSAILSPQLDSLVTVL